MEKLKINYLAVAVCVILGMAIPAFWYAVFSEPWLEGNNLTEEFINENQKSAPYIIALIANIITMYVLAWLFTKLHVTAPIRGALVAFLIGVAFNFVVLYTQNAFAFRPSNLNFIDGGVNLFTWMIAGAILGAWVKRG